MYYVMRVIYKYPIHLIHCPITPHYSGWSLSGWPAQSCRELGFTGAQGVALVKDALDRSDRST